MALTGVINRFGTLLKGGPKNCSTCIGIAWVGGDLYLKLEYSFGRLNNTLTKET
jgi:hypothetical protein